MSNNQEEIWKSLDFMGYPNYEVSSEGRVKSLNYNHTGEEKILRPGKGGDGYLFVVLYKEGKGTKFRVHRLVYSAFNGPIPDGMCVNHMDECTTNNRLENLNLLTHKENMNWGTRNQRISEALKGEKHYNFGKHHSEETKKKLSNAHKGKFNTKKSKKVGQFDLQGTLIAVYPSGQEVKRQLGFCQGHISACCNGKRKSSNGYIWRYI